MSMLKDERAADQRSGEERELLSDQIRNALTDEIASGRLPAGTALTKSI